MTETNGFILKGHKMIETKSGWVCADTGKALNTSRYDIPCGYCGLENTPEGHDGCLGTLPGLMNACCGHGQQNEAYVQFEQGSCLRGAAAVSYQAHLLDRKECKVTDETERAEVVIDLANTGK